MADGLENGFHVVLAVFFILLAGVTGVLTIRTWRERNHAEARCFGGRLLEIVWINMPLLIVITLVCCWLFLKPEPGYAAGGERRSAGGDALRYCESRAGFSAKHSADHLRDRHDTMRNWSGFSCRQ